MAFVSMPTEILCLKCAEKSEPIHLEMLSLTMKLDQNDLREGPGNGQDTVHFFTPHNNRGGMRIMHWNLVSTVSPQSYCICCNMHHYFFYFFKSNFFILGRFRFKEVGILWKRYRVPTHSIPSIPIINTVHLATNTLNILIWICYD